MLLFPVPMHLMLRQDPLSSPPLHLMLQQVCLMHPESESVPVHPVKAAVRLQHMLLRQLLMNLFLLCSC